MEKKIIGVIGSGSADKEQLALAEAVGRLIALHGALLICGGLGGVMEAAARGANAVGGITIGILPGLDKNSANPYISVPIATGLGEIRNAVIVRSSDVLIAIGGEYGTLSEIAFGLKTGKTVIGIETWDIKGIIKASGAEDAVQRALRLTGKGPE